MLNDCFATMGCHDLFHNQQPQTVALFGRIFVTDHIVEGFIQLFNLLVCSPDTVIFNSYKTAVIFGSDTDINFTALFVMVDAVLNEISNCTFQQIPISVYRAEGQRFISFPFNGVFVIRKRKIWLQSFVRWLLVMGYAGQLKEDLHLTDEERQKAEVSSGNR